VIVDTHTHIASPDRARYPLKARALGSQWYRADNVGVSDLLADMDRHGVDRAVVVQGVGAYGYDCAYAIDAVRACPERLRLVGAIDMDSDDPSAAFMALRQAAGNVLCGVRLFGVLGHEPAWLGDRRADAVWELAARHKITIVPTLFPAALPLLASVVARHPHVPVALEHIGFVDLSGGTPFPQAAPLLDLVGQGAVHLKISSHTLEGAEAVGDPADVVDWLAAAFGADRLAWGSDHPQSQHRNYAQKLELARHSARRLARADQDRYLGGTALKLWWPRG
jgi:L-fuconolactonase